MSAPWSLNPSPYLSRFTNNELNILPSCEDHLTLISYEAFSTFTKESQIDPHGIVTFNLCCL